MLLSLTAGDFDQVEVDKFVEESLKMSRFKHVHVMGLIGVCLDTGSTPYIIMPFMANSSLLNYLKRERKNIVLSEDTEEDNVTTPQSSTLILYLTLSVATRGSGATDGHVSPDSQRDGVPGS